MYVNRVILENIRPFERLDFAFERPVIAPGGQPAYAGWTVITGDNASGKSTLLRAIALALLGPEQLRNLGASLGGWVRKGCADGTIAVELVLSERDRFAGGGPRPKGSIWAELRLTEVAREVIVKPGNEYRGKSKGAQNGPWTPGTERWFSAGYGPFRRLYGSSPEAARLMSLPGRSPRFGTMFKEEATLGECETWLKELQFKALEGSEVADRTLKQVLRLLNDQFLRNDLKVDRVDSEGMWLLNGHGLRLPLSEMSDGYRAALAMLVDLTRHIEAVNGSDGLVVERDGRMVVPHAGVVLIDEVDTHLHPEWQRQIGFWLKERFPAIQFIVSSHSAFVCQACDAGGLYHLPAPGNGEPVRLAEDDRQKIIAAQPNEILLSPAFNLTETRSPLAVESRKEYARLKARRRAGLATPEEQAREQQLSLFGTAE